MCSIFSRSRFLLKFGSNSKSEHNLRRFRVCAMDAAASARVSNGGGGVVRFPLSASSALVIQKGDITKWSIDGSTDAIVCDFSSLIFSFLKEWLVKSMNCMIASAAGKSRERENARWWWCRWR